MRWTLPFMLSLTMMPALAQQEPGVDLVSFVADPGSPRGVRIQWGTATESSAGRFVVERSIDTWEWSAVCELPSAGNSSRHVNYETWDLQPPQGVVHYRLTEVSALGTEIISDVFTVRVDPGRGLSVTPENQPGRFMVRATMGQLQDVQLLNNRGQFMPVQLDIRHDVVLLNAELLPSGTYFIQAVIDGMPVLRPVIIGG